MPDVDARRQPPFTIRLAPWAAAAAEELHQQFGNDIELTVGALPYPPGCHPLPAPVAGLPADLLDPREIVAELAGPAVVSSAYTLRHGLLLRNLTGRELQIATDGEVTDDVDPRTGEVVGGFAGSQRLPLSSSGRRRDRPGTLPCYRHRELHAGLGYTIPPGDCEIEATLTLGPYPATRPQADPDLALTITA